MDFSFSFPYATDAGYPEKLSYFSMEFAIHQPLKTYAGGLGFLAGSHMLSAYELKQPMVGVGILWKYGYYDQVRKADNGMEVQFREKRYGFLQLTNIRFNIKVAGHDVTVAAYYLPPEVFGTAPVFFLSTDIEENNYLARTISHRLYDSNPETRMAAAILLGVGGAKLMEHINWRPDIYHLNESHAMPLAFYLFNQYKDINAVRKRLVYTNHTSEAGGNEQTAISQLFKFDFFAGMTLSDVQKIAGSAANMLDYTLAAVLLSGKVNAVSKLHLTSLSRKLEGHDHAYPLLSISNAQSHSYWHDKKLFACLTDSNDGGLRQRKQELKKLLFEEVADQNGEIYLPEVLTIVFAKRFGGYKHPELLLNNLDRFHKIVSNQERPVQIIWAGKPYPRDYNAIAVFEKLINICNAYNNCSVLVGYEMSLSKLLKQGADVWLNVPRVGHEASGTSGMSAAMNGAVNVSMADGWFPEFAKDNINGFVIPSMANKSNEYEADEADAASLYDLLENKVIPLYYNEPDSWLTMVKNSMHDIVPQFDSHRMADEYYKRLYRSSPGDAENASVFDFSKT